MQSQMGKPHAHILVSHARTSSLLSCQSEQLRELEGFHVPIVGDDAGVSRHRLNDVVQSSS